MTGRPRPDPLAKGTLRFRQHGAEVELEVLEGVFAGAGVDAGTKQLLRRLADETFASAVSVLDLGCGYGPLAHWLRAARDDRRVLAVDRDARAVEATIRGEVRNGHSLGTPPRGSLGYDDVAGERVDLVVSNIPAKVGGPALAHLLLDAAHHVVDHGLVAIVVVDRLVAEVAGLLSDPAIEVVATYPTKAYTAFVYRFDDVPATASTERGFDRGVYRRGHRVFTAGKRSWEADVSFSIPEFDELGHGTRAALDVLPSGSGRVLVEGVGQGHVPLALRAGGFTGELRLVDRDLLALRTTTANLGEPANPFHRSRLLADDLGEVELAVVALPEREPVAVTAAVLGEALAGYDRRVLLHGRTADVQRVRELLRRHGCRLVEERSERVHGHTAVLAHPR